MTKREFVKQETKVSEGFKFYEEYLIGCWQHLTPWGVMTIGVYHQIYKNDKGVCEYLIVFKSTPEIMVNEYFDDK